MKRIGVIGIVICGRESVINVQTLLSNYSDIIIGRMGVPDKETDINVLSVIVKGKIEEISALTGKLGQICEVNVKSALTSVEIN